MKTTVKIFPLALIAILTMSLDAKADKNPEKKELKVREEQSVYNMPSSIRGPVLSTKNYVYESVVEETQKNIEIIFITDDSVVTLSINNEGDYEGELENINSTEKANSKIKPLNEKSILEKLRSNLKDLFNQGLTELSLTKEETDDYYSFDHLREDRYFKSDYNTNFEL